MRLRRAIVIVISVCAAAMTLLIIVSSGERLNDLDAAWGAIGGVVALTVLLISVAVRTRTSTTTQTAQDICNELAEAVAVQWQEEAKFRRLDDPAPAPVSWQAAAENMSDALSEVIPIKFRFNSERRRRRYLSGCLNDVLSTYDSLPRSRIVFLGEPGAGKSVAALMLTLRLIQRRKPGDPVPILFPIQSWNPSQAELNPWMVDWMERTYSWLKGPASSGQMSLAGLLVATGRVLPILDGLDEIDDRHQSHIIESINRSYPYSADTPRPIVLTCRTEEFATMVGTSTSGSAPIPLAGTAVVELQPLQALEVQAYLDRLSHFDPRWRDVIDEVVKRPTGAVATTLSSPLMLALARDALGGQPNGPIRLVAAASTSPQEIRQMLLAQTLRSAYGIGADGSSAEWDIAAITRWTTFLAARMEEHNSRDLQWWKLGRILPMRAYWIAFGITTGLVGAVSFFLVAGPLAGLIIGGSILVLAPGLAPVIGVSEPSVVEFAVKRSFPRFAIGCSLGVLAGIVLEILLGLPLVEAVATGLIVGLAGGGACGLEFVLEQQTTRPVAATPISTLRSDRNAFLVRVLGVAPLGGLAVALALLLRPDIGVEFSFRVAIVMGLAIALGCSVVVSLRAGLKVGLAVGIFLGLVGALLLRFVTAPMSDFGSIDGVVLAVWLWLEIAIALSFTSAWGSYTIGRLSAAAVGKLPWRLVGFLDDARERGVLRQAGSVYQFRHAAFQRWLLESAQPSNTGPDLG